MHNNRIFFTDELNYKLFPIQVKEDKNESSDAESAINPDREGEEPLELNTKPIQQGRGKRRISPVKSNNHDADCDEMLLLPKQTEKDNNTHCDICNTTMSTTRGLKLHMRIHLEIFTDTCKICGKKFSKDSSLQKHMKQNHSDLDLLQCSLCDYTANTKNKIRLHSLKKHKGKVVEYLDRLEGLPEWPQSKKFILDLQHRVKEQLPKRAKRSVNTKGLKCLKCSSIFEDISLLKQHMIEHRKQSHYDESSGAEERTPGNEPEKQTESTGLEKVNVKCRDKRIKENSLELGNEEHIEPLDNEGTLHGNQTPSQIESQVGDTVGNVAPLTKDKQDEDISTGIEHSDIHDGKPEAEYNFPCAACDLIFPDLARLKSHRKALHNTRGRGKATGFPCTHCVRVFNHDVDLTDHIKDHEEGKILMCSLCKTGFKQQSTLEDHIFTHSGEYPFKCQDCGKGFARAWALKNHTTEHTKESPYACKYCSVRFKKLDQRLMHYKRQHPQHSQDRKYECPHCGQCYHTIRNLDVHMRKQHKEEPNKPWQCTLCEMNFPHLLEYRNHCKKEHEEEEKRFSCGICGKSFYRKGNLQAHLETHVETKNCECKICFKMFKGKAQLASHMNWHGLKKKAKGQTFLCDECGKSYKGLKGLQAHLRCHKGDRTVQCEVCKLVLPNPSKMKQHLNTVHATERPYKCDICPKTFVYEISYKSHKNMHMDVRPFLCNICGKGFRTRPHLREHMNLHNQVKTFVCNQCNMSFMWRAQLLRHKKESHADPNIPKQPTVKRGPRKKQLNNFKSEREIPQNPGVDSKQISSNDEVINSAGTELLNHQVIDIQPSIEKEETQMETVQNTFVQIKGDGQLQGSLLQGQLLQSLPIHAFVEQPGTSGRKTYVIRPSHFGFVAPSEASSPQVHQVVGPQPENMSVLAIAMQGETILEPVSSTNLTTLQHVPLSVASSTMQLPMSITQSLLPSNTVTQIPNAIPTASALSVQTTMPEVLTSIPSSSVSSASANHAIFTVSSGFSGTDSIISTVATLQPVVTESIQVSTAATASTSANVGVTEARIAAAHLQMQYI